jgi:hypothetical protein
MVEISKKIQKNLEITDPLAKEINKNCKGKIYI